jgi:hypothetical protein
MPSQDAQPNTTQYAYPAYWSANFTTCVAFAPAPAAASLTRPAAAAHGARSRAWTRCCKRSSACSSRCVVCAAFFTSRASYADAATQCSEAAVSCPPPGACARRSADIACTERTSHLRQMCHPARAMTAFRTCVTPTQAVSGRTRCARRALCCAGRSSLVGSGSNAASLQPAHRSVQHVHAILLRDRAAGRRVSVLLQARPLLSYSTSCSPRSLVRVQATHEGCNRAAVHHWQLRLPRCCAAADAKHAPRLLDGRDGYAARNDGAPVRHPSGCVSSRAAHSARATELSCALAAAGIFLHYDTMSCAAHNAQDGSVTDATAVRCACFSSQRIA